MSKIKGEVRSIESNFGFIVYENKESIFFHFSSLIRGFKVKINDHVLFDKVESKRKPGKFDAINIERNEVYYKKIEDDRIEGEKISENKVKVEKWLNYELDNISNLELGEFIKSYDFSGALESNCPKGFTRKRKDKYFFKRDRGRPSIRNFQNPFSKIFSRLKNNNSEEDFIFELISCLIYEADRKLLRIYYCLLLGDDIDSSIKKKVVQRISQSNNSVLIIICWVEYFMKNITVDQIYEGFDKFNVPDFELNTLIIIEKLNEEMKLDNFLTLIANNANILREVQLITKIDLILNQEYPDIGLKTYILDFFSKFLDDDVKFLLWRKSNLMSIDDNILGEKVAKSEISYIKNHDLDLIKSFKIYNRLLLEKREEVSQRLVLDGFIKGLEADEDSEIISIKVLSLLNEREINFPNEKIISELNRLYFLDQINEYLDSRVRFNLWLLDQTIHVSLILILENIHYLRGLTGNFHRIGSGPFEKVLNFLNHKDFLLKNSLKYFLEMIDESNEEDTIEIIIHLINNRISNDFDFNSNDLNEINCKVSFKSQFKLWINGFSDVFNLQLHIICVKSISYNEVKTFIDKGIFRNLKGEDLTFFIKTICSSKDFCSLSKIKYILECKELMYTLHIKSLIFESVSKKICFELWLEDYYDYCYPNIICEQLIENYSSNIIIKTYKDNLIIDLLGILAGKFHEISSNKRFLIFKSFLSESFIEESLIYNFLFNKLNLEEKKNHFLSVVKMRDVNKFNEFLIFFLKEINIFHELSFLIDSLFEIILIERNNNIYNNPTKNYGVINIPEKEIINKFHILKLKLGEIIVIIQGNYLANSVKYLDEIAVKVNDLSITESYNFFIVIGEFIQKMNNASNIYDNEFIFDVNDFHAKLSKKLKPEILIKFWVKGAIEYFDYNLYASYYFLLSSDQRRIFNKKVKVLMGDEIKQSMLKKKIPWEKISVENSEHECYEATWKSVWFNDGFINFLMDNSPSFSSKFSWKFSEEKFNLIVDYLSGRKLNKLLIYANKNNVHRVEGLEELEEIIYKVLITHELQPGNGSNSKPNFFTKIPNNLILRNKCVQFLNNLQLNGFEPSRILEKTFNVSTGGYSADISLLYSIPIDNESVGIIWESLELEKSKATHVFKCSLGEYDDIFSEILTSLNSVNKVRSLLNGIKSEDLIKQKELRYLGKVDHSNFNYYKWEFDLLEMLPSLRKLIMIN
jgi:hypothetical protein